MDRNIIEMKGISKQFNNIWVLHNVDFDLKCGEVHALFGENGAGKSVLMKILSGVIQPDLGEIFVAGEKVEMQSPIQAQLHGIRTIHQEQNLIPDLTVAENIFISRMSSVINKLKIIKRGKMFEECGKILESLGFDIDPRSILKELGTGERQQVEIAKALAYNSSVIIMDEPTNSLTEVEISKLYSIINNLKAKGISIIYISHRIEEVLRICDRVTIIRDGEIIETNDIASMNKEMLISLSVGKDYKDRYPKLPVQKGRVLFKAVNISTERKIHDIRFDVRKGEILGIAGLVGSGRTAIARAIFGIDRLLTGELYLNGSRLDLKSPRDAIKAGIGYVSEERIDEGLIGEFDIPKNITLSKGSDDELNYLIDASREKDVARKYIKKLVIKTPFVEQKAKNLSGGNQQKVVLSKWLYQESKLFIFDEPTMGLDTGSKVEVYNIMNEIVLNGSGIILISSDLSELIGMSDRILVIYNGSISGELSRNEFSTGKVLSLASGTQFSS